MIRALLRPACMREDAVRRPLAAQQTAAQQPRNIPARQPHVAPAQPRVDPAGQFQRMAEAQLVPRFQGGILVPVDRPAPTVRRTWHLAPASGAERDLLRTWLTSPSDSANLALWRAFEVFRRHEAATMPTELAIGLFCAKARRHGRESTSCLTYARTLLQCAVAEGLMRPNTSAATKLLRGIALEACDSKVLHARDVSVEQAQALLRQARLPELRYAVFWMFTSGMRLADLNRFTAFSFELVGESLRIDVRVAKNVRSPDERYSLNLPLRSHDPLCLQWLREKRRPTMSCDSMNNALKAIAVELGWEMTDAKRARDQGRPDLRAPTTYSLRRNFMHHVIDVCTRDSDAGKLVDWMAAIQLTGHQKAATLRASYAF
jgi:hypothetical protein